MAAVAHEVIADYLRELVKKSAAGDRLPSDRELCERFGVSKMTARQAVGALVRDGRAYRVVGKGTFVSSFPVVHRRVSRLLSFVEHMQRQGRVPSSVVLSHGRRQGTAEECVDLRQTPGSAVYDLERLLSGDGVPIVIESAVLSERVAAAVDDVVAHGGSLHEALDRIGHRPARSYGTVAAESATPQRAQLLSVPVGGALMIYRQVAFDAQDEPVELVTSRYVGDRFVLDIDQHRVPLSELPRPEDDPHEYVLKSLGAR